MSPFVTITIVETICFVTSLLLGGMKMNLPLKIALLRAGMRQIDLARRTGLGESRVSRIVNAYYMPTPEEKRKIARALDHSVEELWPEREKACADH
jgi:lambda repressor-like predicted transcriptional regulator